MCIITKIITKIYVHYIDSIALCIDSKDLSISIYLIKYIVAVPLVGGVVFYESAIIPFLPLPAPSLPSHS